MPACCAYIALEFSTQELHRQRTVNRLVSVPPGHGALPCQQDPSKDAVHCRCLQHGESTAGMALTRSMWSVAGKEYVLSMEAACAAFVAAALIWHSSVRLQQSGPGIGSLANAMRKNEF